MIDIEVGMMSEETRMWLNELFSTCKQFGVNYYRADEKERFFVENVARHNFALKKAMLEGKGQESVPPFLGLPRIEKTTA